MRDGLEKWSQAQFSCSSPSQGFFFKFYESFPVCSSLSRLDRVRKSETVGDEPVRRLVKNRMPGNIPMASEVLYFDGC